MAGAPVSIWSIKSSSENLFWSFSRVMENIHFFLVHWASQSTSLADNYIGVETKNHRQQNNLNV